jgi:hypothetical protein
MTPDRQPHAGADHNELRSGEALVRSVDATRSPFYAWLDSTTIRELVQRADDLSAGELLVMIKGLLPRLIDDIGTAAFERFLDELRVKGQRYAEAVAHPGEGSAARRTPSEPLGGPITHGQAHLPGTRDPRRPGGRAGERRLEADFWNRIDGPGAKEPARI